MRKVLIRFLILCNSTIIVSFFLIAILVAVPVATASTTPHPPVWKEKNKHHRVKARGVLAVCHVVGGPTPPQRPPAKTVTTIRKKLLPGMPGAKERRVPVLRSDLSVPQVSVLALIFFYICCLFKNCKTQTQTQVLHFF